MGKKIVGVRRRGKNSFEIRYYDLNGVRQHETIKAVSAADAGRVRETRIGDLARGIAINSRPQTVRFEELAADVVNDYIVNKHSSKSDIEARFRKHLNPIFGAKKAATITTASIKAYIVYRQKQEAATGTINRELEAMRRAFNLAVKGKKLLSQPHIPMLRETNVRQGFFSRQEVDRLAAVLPAPIDSMVWFAFLTGWRLGEIRELEWRNVDFKAGEVRLDAGTTKNREGRVFPMSKGDDLYRLLDKLRTPAGANAAALRPVTDRSVPAVRALQVNIGIESQEPPATATQPKTGKGSLESMKRSGVATATPYVFAIDGAPVGEFRKTWATACYRAGLPCTVHFKRDAKGDIVLGKERANKGKPAIDRIEPHRIFHDLRRSAVRELVRVNGLSEREAMILTGHKTRSVFDRYSVVSHTDLDGIREKLSGGKNGGNSGTGNART